MMKEPKIILITICFSLVKSIIYGIMLWLPLYFKQRDGFAGYAESIPITYDASAIIGSVFIGYLFIKIKNKGLLMIPFMTVLVFNFFYLKFIQTNVIFVFMIISLTGFCLGGIFNTLAGLVVIQLASFLPEALKLSSLGFYSALTMAAGNVTTAATQLLIGLVIGKEHQEGIFLIFMIYSALSLLCLICISIIHAKSKTVVGQLNESIYDNKGSIACSEKAEAPSANSTHAMDDKNRLLFNQTNGKMRLSKIQSISQIPRTQYLENDASVEYETYWGQKNNGYQ